MRPVRESKMLNRRHLARQCRSCELKEIRPRQPAPKMCSVRRLALQHRITHVSHRPPSHVMVCSICTTISSNHLRKIHAASETVSTCFRHCLVRCKARDLTLTAERNTGIAALSHCRLNKLLLVFELKLGWLIRWWRGDDAWSCPCLRRSRIGYM